MEDDNFGDNPFRKLDLAAFPKKRARAMPRRSPEAGGFFQAEPREDEVSEEDRNLFIRSIAAIPKHGDKPRPSGFLLAEQCDLAISLKKMKKKHKKEISETAGQTPVSPPPSRHENEDDAFLWAMRGISPLEGSGRRVARTPKVNAAPPARDPGMEDFMAGNLEFALSNTDEYVAGHVVGMDELTINQLAIGQYSPEAHLDLHGLNAMQAFETLREFARNCWFKGLRVALVITGRGRNSPEGHAVLRQKLQTWLTQEPFKRVVLAFCTAQPYDGGPGAIYVLFRKYKKKGRIYWNRLPADADLYSNS